MVRADYCGEGRPHTVDGTRIDVCAGLGITYLDRGAVMAAWWPSNVRGVPAPPPPDNTSLCRGLAGRAYAVFCFARHSLQSHRGRHRTRGFLGRLPRDPTHCVIRL